MKKELVTQKSVRIQKCTIADCKYLAELNKELINAESSDNPMTIRELEERMKDFLQTSYEAFFFIEQDVVVGYALVKMDCKPLYLRQYMIRQEYRRKHYGEQAFQILLSCLQTDYCISSVKIVTHRKTVES